MDIFRRSRPSDRLPATPSTATATPAPTTRRRAPTVSATTGAGRSPAVTSGSSSSSSRLPAVTSSSSSSRLPPSNLTPTSRPAPQRTSSQDESHDSADEDEGPFLPAPPADEYDTRQDQSDAQFQQQWNTHSALIDQDSMYPVVISTDSIAKDLQKMLRSGSNPKVVSLSVAPKLVGIKPRTNAAGTSVSAVFVHGEELDDIMDKYNGTTTRVVVDRRPRGAFTPTELHPPRSSVQPPARSSAAASTPTQLHRSRSSAQPPARSSTQEAPARSGQPLSQPRPDTARREGGSTDSRRREGDPRVERTEPRVERRTEASVDDRRRADGRRV